MHVLCVSRMFMYNVYWYVFHYSIFTYLPQSRSGIRLLDIKRMFFVVVLFAKYHCVFLCSIQLCTYQLLPRLCHTIAIGHVCFVCFYNVYQRCISVCFILFNSALHISISVASTIWGSTGKTQCLVCFIMFIDNASCLVSLFKSNIYTKKIELNYSMEPFRAWGRDVSPTLVRVWMMPWAATLRHGRFLGELRGLWLAGQGQWSMRAAMVPWGTQGIFHWWLGTLHKTHTLNYTQLTQ